MIVPPRLILHLTGVVPQVLPTVHIEVSQCRARTHKLQGVLVGVASKPAAVRQNQHLQRARTRRRPGQPMRDTSVPERERDIEREGARTLGR